jgi:hypothetical protein
MQWHRSEPRDVRPFYRIDAEQALDETTIRLFDDGDELGDEGFDLDEIDFQKLAPTIFPRVADPATWLPEDFSESDFDLVVIARHSTLKRSEILHRQSLADPVVAEVSVGNSLVQALAGGRNAQFITAICLAEDRKVQPGAPYVVGHWIARKAVAVRPRTNPTLFDLRTRSDEEWLAAGYPAKSLYAVDYGGGIEIEADEDAASVATVYIHEDAYNRMTSSPLGEQLQPLLGAEIITTILQLSFKEWSKLDGAPQGSPLARFHEEFNKSGQTSFEQLKDLVSNQAPKLRAVLQDRLGATRALS